MPDITEPLAFGGQSEDEQLDVVNAEDVVVGTIRRSDFESLGNGAKGFTRIAEMFIVNDHGELWIPKRTDHKKIAPGGLDYSMGGHVESGETYVQAALRECQEELNLTLTEHDLEFVTKFPPNELGYIRSLYLYRSNNAPNFNRDDYVSATWLTPEALLDAINTGTPAKFRLPEAVEQLKNLRPDLFAA